MIDVSLSFALVLIGDLKSLPLQGNRIPFSYDGALIGVLRFIMLTVAQDARIEERSSRNAGHLISSRRKMARMLIVVERER